MGSKLNNTLSSLLEAEVRFASFSRFTDVGVDPPLRPFVHYLSSTVTFFRIAALFDHMPTFWTWPFDMVKPFILLRLSIWTELILSFLEENILKHNEVIF